MTLRDYVKEKWQTDLKPTLKAMGRQGASELAQALKAFPDSVQPIETTGGVGNPTQQQISQEKGLYGNRQSAAEPPANDATVHGKAHEPEREPDYEP